MEKLSAKNIVTLAILFSLCFVSLLWFLSQKNQKPIQNNSTVPTIVETQVQTITKPKEEIPPTPTKPPTIKPTSITYTLSTGWSQVSNPSGIFTVGYNPATQDVKIDGQTITLTYKNLLNNPYYSPYSSSQVFKLLTYDNGSRHTFIEKQLGEPVNSGNKTPGFVESNFYIDGKNCLVLNGISISQYYSVWGMCVINSKQALLFNSFNYADLSQHLSSLKFN